MKQRHIILKHLTAYWRSNDVFPVFGKGLDSTGLHLLRPTQAVNQKGKYPNQQNNEK